MLSTAERDRHRRAGRLGAERVASRRNRRRRVSRSLCRLVDRHDTREAATKHTRALPPVTHVCARYELPASVCQCCPRTSFSDDDGATGGGRNGLAANCHATLRLARTCTATDGIRNSTRQRAKKGGKTRTHQPHACEVYRSLTACVWRMLAALLLARASPKCPCACACSFCVDVASGTASQSASLARRTRSAHRPHRHRHRRGGHEVSRGSERANEVECACSLVCGWL